MRYLLLLYLFPLFAIYEPSLPDLNKETPSASLSILHLTRAGKVEDAIALYQEEYKKSGEHDFEILEQMGQVLLEKGAKSENLEEEFLSLFGTQIAGHDMSLSIARELSQSPNEFAQLAALNTLSALHDDQVIPLLDQMMHSPFFTVRMTALWALCQKKAPSAHGQVESLMNKVPPMFRQYFPGFYALLGTHDAIITLKRLIQDRDMAVKVQAIMSAIFFDRDDLLPYLRSAATHTNVAEQEAAAIALGALRDSYSIPRLEELAQSPHPNVKLASSIALYDLGKQEYKETVLALARDGDPFAVYALQNFDDTEPLLASLLLHSDDRVRLNAAISLIHLHSTAAIPYIKDIIIPDARDISFLSLSSPGQSLTAWRAIFASKQQNTRLLENLEAKTILFREEMLAKCLEFPENEFLKIARMIFHAPEARPLVPFLISLLENLRTPAVIALLKERAEVSGSPFSRMYAILSLYRLRSDPAYETILLDWIEKSKGQPMQIRAIDFEKKQGDTPFQLTPTEEARLLWEAYLAIAENSASKTIEILLDSIATGNPANRPALAGILLHAIQ